MENNLKVKKFSKIKYLFPFIATLILWGITFVWDRKIFTHDALYMNSLPIDESAVPWMHVLTKIIVLILLYGICRFVIYALKHPRIGLVFCFLFAIYFGLLLLQYPGYYMSDDTIILGYATRYYPVYWHNYLTSLYYTVAMSIIPASTGPVILNGFFHALCYTYIFARASKLFPKISSYFFLLCAITPFTLLGSLMSFRPSLYAPFFIFYYAYLIFDYKEKAKLTLPKFCIILGLNVLLCFWRSEGIVLILFSIIALFVVYHISFKQVIIFMVSFVLLFGVVKFPQSIGEQKYYGKDYLILSTIRPLSLIYHRKKTYENSEKDWENINQIVALDYLSYETLSCSSYNRYNADVNQGRFTQTFADAETQDAYLKSALRLISHNLDLFLAERFQLFLVSNGYFNYNPELVMNLEPVTTANYTLYASDKEYGYTLLEGNKRLPLQSNQEVITYLFEHGGEAYFMLLCLLIITMVLCIKWEEWFLLTLALSLCAREGIIFLASPAAFIQYNYPTMYVILFIFIYLLLQKFVDMQQKKGINK